MRTVEQFPHPVREHRDVWLPMSDGTRLAARLRRSEDTGPVPAVPEFHPLAWLCFCILALHVVVGLERRAPKRSAT